ncbi:DUF2513 domain-containing protein [Methylobacterium sp. WL30]|nr:DUF2513 domain-containing protein [Methylobacterium sp. WL93]TXN50014.1 DUF2513 domain-containing protein [Methylobacterium sp. WL119]TXN63901.1 DUF2513 domain-containing protein [Methylobacterium sp. WL30]
MKCDMDLVRNILLALEAEPQKPSSASLRDDLGEAEPHQVADHIRLMEDAGLVTCIRSAPLASHWRCQNIDLTWEGHDFLDTVRDPEVWKRTKDGASKMGGWTFGLLKDLGTAYLKHVAKERLGLDL